MKIKEILWWLWMASLIIAAVVGILGYGVWAYTVQGGSAYYVFYSTGGKPLYKLLHVYAIAGWFIWMVIFLKNPENGKG